MARADSGRTYRGMTAEERAGQRRRRLLDAGLELFGTKGYAATSIPALCAEAGVSPGHFYEAFPSREAVLRAVYEEIVAESSGGAEASVEADGDPLARIRTGLERFVAPLLADERKARVQFLEVVGVSAEFEVLRREVLRAFAGRIELAASAILGEEALAGRELGIVAMALVGATNEPLSDWFARPAAERPPIDRVLEELSRVYAAALVG
jgi:AcrR family transcriptional regulator